MTRSAGWKVAFGVGVLAAAVAATASSGGKTAAASTRGATALVRRGEYLVKIGGCNDCHTPLVMGPKGPAPDVSRMLSGHPEGLRLPPAPELPKGPWVAVASGSMTAWSGPWGVSFTANITSDPETGIGGWAEKDFVQAMRTGRHLGKGRPILPPMPVASLQAMTDDDLAAVFAYLKSTPPVKNRVPDPLPPAGAQQE